MKKGTFNPSTAQTQTNFKHSAFDLRNNSLNLSLFQKLMLSDEKKSLKVIPCVHVYIDFAPFSKIICGLQDVCSRFRRLHAYLLVNVLTSSDSLPSAAPT